MQSEIGKQLARVTMVLFGIVLAVAFVLAQAFGLWIDMNISTNIPIIIQRIITLGLLYINTEFALAFTLKTPFKGHTVFAVCLTVGLYTATYFNQSVLISGIFPALSTALFSIIKARRVKQVIIRSAIWNVAMIGYQLLLSYICFAMIPVYAFTENNGIVSAIINIDLLIFSYTLLSLGGVDYVLRPSKLVVFPESVSETESVSEEERVARNEIAALKEKGGKEWAVFTLKNIAFTVFQMCLVGIACKIGDNLFVGLTVMFSFLIYGTIITRRWHSSSLSICTAMSIGLFFTAARIIPPFFLLAPVVAGLGLDYMFYRIEIYAEKAQANAAKVAALNSFALVKGCNFEKMKEIAISKNLPDYDIKILQSRYCDGISIDKMADMFFHSASTIKRHLKKAEAKFAE